ncbi:MAG: hypothetical protein GH150_00880 [Hadesarchaea archaeon]|nr:hypothetical protein [Hadesarchaea archaeon]
MVKNKSKPEFRLIEVEKGVYTLPYSGKHAVVEVKIRGLTKGAHAIVKGKRQRS